jgi:hypothetical protein
MPRLLLTIFAAFLMCLGACGLNVSERAVANANAAIEAVREASDDVAGQIHLLPDRTLNAADFVGVRSALTAYIERVEALNAALREMGTHFSALEPHLNETFRPAAEASLTVCQTAHDALANESSTEEDFRRALTRVGLCLDRYATAVTNVSAEYERVTN